MATQPIVANIAAGRVAEAEPFPGNGSAALKPSIADEGGSDMPVPDISANEPWDVRRFRVRDLFKKLVNTLAHAS